MTITHRIALFGAGTLFAAGLALMQPQMTALQDMSGAGSFMRSLAEQPNAWLNGHLVMLAAALLYILAGQAAGARVGERQPLLGAVTTLLFLVGGLGLVGNFTLDFVYGALASGLTAEAAQAARIAILDDPVSQMLFAQVGPGILLLGMLTLALTALITGWVPRMAGVLIIGGWAIVLGLHGQFPYAEALGHLVIGTAFWTIALSKSGHRRE